MIRQYEQDAQTDRVRVAGGGGRHSSRRPPWVSRLSPGLTPAVILASAGHELTRPACLRPCALRHRGLLTLSLTALCYNGGFFTVLGYAPFPLGLTPSSSGWFHLPGRAGRDLRRLRRTPP